jgi:hypothetical protein
MPFCPQDVQKGKTKQPLLVQPTTDVTDLKFYPICKIIYASIRVFYSADVYIYTSTSYSMW